MPPQRTLHFLGTQPPGQARENGTLFTLGPDTVLFTVSEDHSMMANASAGSREQVAVTGAARASEQMYLALIANCQTSSFFLIFLNFF